MKGKKDLYQALEALLGAGNVCTDTQTLRWFARDALRAARGFREDVRLQGEPDLVVKPASTDEVAAVVCLATQCKVPIVPYGGGTGLMGGARAIQGGIVIDFSRMTKILRIAPEDRMIIVQAGATFQAIDTVLSPYGLMGGHDPWTVSMATVGGAISTNGLGYRAARYGSMGAQVLGLRVVLPSGKILDTRAVPKSSTGIDLKQLFIGAEGVLGLITEASLCVFTIPERREFFAFAFPDFAAGFQALVALFHLGLHPALAELEETFSGETPPVKLYLVCEGFREEVEGQQQRLVPLCHQHGGTDLGKTTAQQFWHTRHAIAERYQRERLRRWNEGKPLLERPGSFDYLHVALPLSQVLTYREQAQQILTRHGVHLQECGIWTQPALFSMALRTPDSSPSVPPDALAKAMDDLLMLAQDLGGSMEYCHGVGIRLAHLLERELGQTGLAVLRQIKRTLDPENLCNPGKLNLTE
jgi:alkyldihydroxyacetonephosphate synthase